MQVQRRYRNYFYSKLYNPRRFSIGTHVKMTANKAYTRCNMSWPSWDDYSFLWKNPLGDDLFRAHFLLNNQMNRFVIEWSQPKLWTRRKIYRIFNKRDDRNKDFPVVSPKMNNFSLVFLLIIELLISFINHASDFPSVTLLSFKVNCFNDNSLCSFKKKKKGKRKRKTHY